MIRQAVRALAVLMTLVILLGVVDVGWESYNRVTTPPRFVLAVTDVLATFGTFMAVRLDRPSHSQREIRERRAAFPVTAIRRPIGISGTFGTGRDAPFGSVDKTSAPGPRSRRP